MRTAHSRDVDLGEDRTLRVCLFMDADGAPDRLVLAVGTGEGRSWREIPGESLDVPADALSGLLGALMSVRGDALE